MRKVISLKINWGIFFFSSNLYNFDKVNSNFTKSECKSLKELMKRKDLVIQKSDKVNTVVTTHQ